MRVTQASTDVVLENLAEVLRENFVDALAGRGHVEMFDWPEHGNIGDSAIALGELAIFRSLGCDIDQIYPYHAAMVASKRRASKSRVSGEAAIVLAGGGFFGGLYPRHDRLRQCVARENCDVIQAPQSIAAVDFEVFRKYSEFSERSDICWMVRDTSSVAALDSLGVAASLVPDAAHGLGLLDAGEATQAHVVLLREDSESTGLADGRSSSDWPESESTFGRAMHALSAATAAVAPSVNVRLGFEGRARRRLELGLDALGAGEVVITDRLHAMLLALLAGRRVVFIDNSVRKLSRYAETWLADVAERDLRLATDLDEALALASS